MTFDPEAEARPLVSGVELKALAQQTVAVEVVPDGDYQKGSNFFLYVFELGERGVLRLCADRRFLARRSSAGFLLELESFLLEAVLP